MTGNSIVGWFKTQRTSRNKCLFICSVGALKNLILTLGTIYLHLTSQSIVQIWLTILISPKVTNHYLFKPWVTSRAYVFISRTIDFYMIQSTKHCLNCRRVAQAIYRTLEHLERTIVWQFSRTSIVVEFSTFPKRALRRLLQEESFATNYTGFTESR